MITTIILLLLTICALIITAIIMICAEILAGYTWERSRSGYKGWRDKLAEYGAQLYRRQQEARKKKQ